MSLWLLSWTIAYYAVFFPNIWGFPIFLFLMSNLLVLSSEKICDIISIYWGLFHGPAYGLSWWLYHVYLKKIYSRVLGCCVLQIPIKSRWLIVLFKSSKVSLIFLSSFSTGFWKRGIKMIVKLFVLLILLFFAL